MTGPEDLLAIVPARGGSKGIRGKNLIRIGDRPLLGHTLDALRASGVATRIVVSSDDPPVGRCAA